MSQIGTHSDWVRESNIYALINKAIQWERKRQNGEAVEKRFESCFLAHRRHHHNHLTRIRIYGKLDHKRKHRRNGSNRKNRRVLPA